MGKERTFYTGSVEIMKDPRLSGMDHRVYACVSLHDGMSLMKGKGRGCFATFATMMSILGCDAANLSRSLKRLVDWGYLTEERQSDRRRKSYRVVFEFDESWLNDQQSRLAERAKEVGNSTNNLENAGSEIVGREQSENGGNPLRTRQHYSSLKGLDSLEREKLNSSEEARFAARSRSKMEFSDNVGAQLATLERALKAGEKVDGLAWSEWLEGQIDAAECVERSAHVGRLSEMLLDAMDDDEYRTWREKHGWAEDDYHPRAF